MSVAFPRRSSVVLIVTAGALALVSSLSARADEPPPGWSGKGQLGYLMSRGNSDADSANANLAVNYVVGDWKHSLYIEGLYGKSAGIVSAERWDLRWQSNYNITSRLFAFGALDYQNDKFSGFQYQASGSAGLGYKFIDSDTTKLTGQVGPGYRKLRPELLIKDGTGAVVERIPQDAVGNAIITAGIDFEHAFNDITKVTDKFLLESGSANTSFKNDLALEVKMSKKLALAAGYRVLYNSAPPVGLVRTDRITTLNLVYNF